MDPAVRGGVTMTTTLERLGIDGDGVPWEEVEAAALARFAR